MQENIKDKLHGIPIEVSVKIQDGSRKRRQSGAAQLAPVLDAKDETETRTMVRPLAWFVPRYLLYSILCVYTVIVLLCENYCISISEHFFNV